MRLGSPSSPSCRAARDARPRRIRAVQAQGLPVDIGPFRSMPEGDGNDVAAAFTTSCAALFNGASHLFVQVERVEDDR